MAGDDVTIGVGPGSKDDYRKVNVDNRSENSGDGGGDLVTSRLPCGADYFSVSYPSATQEVYTFKRGGSGGTVVGTCTINYVDASKASLVDGVWT